MLQPADDSVAALLAKMQLEDDEAATAAPGTPTRSAAGEEDEDAIVSFIADAGVNFDDELELLRRGGPGALREHALQEALADISATDTKLRLQVPFRTHWHM